MMKQVSQNYKSGALRLEDVTDPALKPGGILVRTRFSLISIGTEGMKVREAKMSLIEKARARPDQVKKVLASVQQQGLSATIQKVMNKLDSLTPLGYSLAGEVIAVGRDCPDFTVGQRVACAGAGYANHAEVNYIPRNLAVPVPDGVSLEHAAFATVGAIAMQGYRQSDMQLGEHAVVIGLGLIGQLLVQLLVASGVTVIGVDLAPDRCRLAVACGAAFACPPGDPDLHPTLERLTGGAGADTVFITAGGDSNGPAELAVKVARDRARVVDIGKTRLDLSWKDYYEKELDVRFSRSYGPGRYDPNYEEQGIDYPIGYVRWTERRNLASFIDLLRTGRLNLDPLISGVHPFTEAEQVYGTLADNAGSVLGVLFRYDGDTALAPRPATTAPAATAPTHGPVRLNVIGAGNYAASMLLPHLAAMPGVALGEVATASSLSGENAKRKFHFARHSTDAAATLAAPDADAVLIATRHASHASLTAAALRAGKAVFVEKPLAIDRDGLRAVMAAAEQSGNARLQVGFNRRFSPAVTHLAHLFTGRAHPLTLLYRVHAGPMPQTSWYRDPSEGTRFIGEAGHFLDVMAFLTGAAPVRVSAQRLTPAMGAGDEIDNVIATITYADGSVGTLLYLTQGNIKLPKEYLEVHGGGRSAQLHNFEHTEVYEGLKKKTVRFGAIDKGQKQELAAFIAAVKNGTPLPIPYDSLIETTLTTLALDTSLRAAGHPVELATCWTDTENVEQKETKETNIDS
jgi:predicted dehydrogenase/threonine dehydrogenase-like Zn-dependent dehydrogenase